MNWKPRPNTRAKRAVRQQALDRANGRCQIRIPGTCIGTATIADHRIPLAEGGRDDLTNLQAACDPCHHIKTQQEAERGQARVQAKLTRPQPKHPGLR